MLRCCLVCGRPSATNRCAQHAQAARTGSTRAYRRARAQVLANTNTCWLCREGPRPGDPFETDHVIAHALGGGDNAANLRVAHRSCNNRRGAARIA